MEPLIVPRTAPGRRTPQRPRRRILALTGLPGAGVSTVARAVSESYGALPLSLATLPARWLGEEWGLPPEDPAHQRLLLDLRLRGEHREGLYWIRPFHRRLQRVLRADPARRVVITGGLTPREIAYCQALGARLIHLTAPEGLRRRRIGLRFPEPHPAYDLLQRLVQTRPQLWHLIVDTDEPYPEFIRSFRALLGEF